MAQELERGGQDPDQERTRGQERRALATCDCGRDWDCDRDCHYDCDCDHDRDRARCTDGTRSLPADDRCTGPSTTVHDHACSKDRSFGGVCGQGKIRWRRGWSRGQDPEQEQTREQGRGGAVATCDCGRECDCGRGCRYDCDCDRDHDCARRTAGTRSLPACLGVCPTACLLVCLPACLTVCPSSG